MLEPRTIDSTMFFARRDGRRETILTPDEAVAAMKGRITAGQANAAELRAALQAAEHSLKAALINGDDTRHRHAEIATIRARIAEAEQDVSDARAGLATIAAALDQAEATRIREADARRLAKLTAPFDQLMKETFHVR